MWPRASAQRESTVKYMLLIYASEAVEAAMSPEEQQASFAAHIAYARELAGPRWAGLVDEKRRRRIADEALKPLERYREEELARMKLNFYGFDPSYHVARYHFVHKLPKARTPHYLAPHRTAPAPRQSNPDVLTESPTHPV